jgi:hypothetical protein
MKEHTFDNKLAEREGWGLYDCFGSESGTPQVQRNDDADILESDTDAWAIVANGDKPHHIAVKEILAQNNPEELNRIQQLKTK